MNVQSVGSMAAELLEEPHTVVVQGSTRQGVFLRLGPGWMIFLSREAECGPLTVNIEHDLGQLSDLAIGAQIEVATVGSYPNQNISASRSVAMKPSPPKSEMASSNIERSPGNDVLLLDIHHAQVWSAPPRPAEVLPAAERVLAVDAAIRQAQRIRPTASLTALQAIPDGASHAPEGDAGHFFPHLARIKDQLTGRQRPTSTALASPLRQIDPHSLSALLGLGRGLTPTGDDILLGLLLALNRWRPVLAPGLDIGLLNRDILAQAYQKTTTISANLIECASRGQADERLITALDGLVTGAPVPAEAAQLLAGWGSSSGLDALCGMALVILSRRHQL